MCLRRLFGCDGEVEEDPRKHAALVLIAQALIGAVQAGGLAEGLGQAATKLGALPVVMMKPKQG